LATSNTSIAAATVPPEAPIAGIVSRSAFARGQPALDLFAVSVDQ
jgi:hypothetical protein